nr:MAG TPA: hypothetical protein [Caudoviricetes sp.]
MVRKRQIPVCMSLLYHNDTIMKNKNRGCEISPISGL